MAASALKESSPTPHARADRRSRSQDGEYADQMNGPRVRTLVGGIIAAVGGFFCGLAVIATFAVGFDGGANIGAGILLLLGVPLAIVGGLLLLIGAVGLIARR